MPDDTPELARTFDEVGGDFDTLTPTVWGPAGQALIFQLGLRPGAHVLDACCGTGASALPAAAAVGPDGRVHGVDVAGNLLERGRLVAEQRALKNIDFVCADVTEWEKPSDIPAEGYDALAISYGVFFLPHMDSAFARLVGLVRHGGRVGVTVWRSDGIERFTELVYDVAARHSPGLADSRPGGNDLPWRTIHTPTALEAWLAAAGAHSVEVRTLSNLLPTTDELCWNMVKGTGLRSVLSGLDADGIEAMRRDILTEVTARGVHTIDATTLVGTATVRRPPATV